MSSLETTENEVKQILEKIPTARNNDMILYYEYCIGKWVRDTELYKVFNDSDFRKNKNIAVFESVSRARRKLQEKYEYLRPTSEVQKFKQELEEEYKNYYRK